MTEKMTALDALQSGLENVQRVIDVHGDCATSTLEEAFDAEESIYDLEIAADYLRQAERLLEAEAGGAWETQVSSLSDPGTTNEITGG